MAPTRSPLSTWILAAVAALLVSGCSYDLSELSPEELASLEQSIVNGAVDTGHDAVGLIYLKGVPSCTATLIGSRTVLTAAHCVTDATVPPYTPIFPITFATGPGTSSPIYMAETVTIHQGYGAKVDLALVRLKQPVQGVTPVPIADMPPKVGEAVTLVGYGFTADAAATSFGVKRKAHNTIGKVGSPLLTFYGASGSVGNICFGDSGGPALAKRGGQEVLVGVHSYGEGACGVTEHDVRTDTFLHWIAQAALGDLLAPAQQPQGDSAPPAVAILSPGARDQLGSSFSVKLSATDDVAVARVELYLDGQLRYAKTTAPFSFSYRLDGVPSGTRTIRADAVDIVGRRSSTLIQVAVSAGGQPSGTNPTVTTASQGVAGPDDAGVLIGSCALSPGRAGADASWAVLPLLALLMLALAGPTRWWSRRGRTG